MKKWLPLLIAILLLPGWVMGQQNLVYNPNFEINSGCPSNVSQVTSRCTGWRSYTSSSPDYLHTCGASNVGVPNNYAGYQQPLNGNAYCGIITHYTPTTHYEYIAARIPALEPGGLYEVSMSVSRGAFALATNNIGVFFYDTMQVSINTTALLSVTPQVHYSGLGAITDTANWIRLQSTFTADSAYDNFIIGPYNDVNNTYVTDTVSSGSYYAYYYIDSVVVRQLDSFYLNPADTLWCTGDTVNIPYVAWSNVYPTTNVFTIQLSDTGGNFGSPVNIGSLMSDTSGTIQCVIPTNLLPSNKYKIRGTSSAPAAFSKTFGKAIKIGDAKPLKPNASSNSPVCSSDTLKLTASSSTQGVTYKWTGPNNFLSYLQNPQVIKPPSSAIGDFIVSARYYGCTSEDTVNVVIVDAGQVSINDTNNPVCERSTVIINTAGPSTGATFAWTGPNNFTSNAKSPQIPNVTTAATGQYFLTAVYNGCTTLDTVSITVKPLPAAFDAISNSPVCNYDTIKLTASTTTSTGVIYWWTGPNSYVSALQNSKIAPAMYTDTGNYIVLATLNGCSITDTANVQVKESPRIVTAGNNGPVCEPDNLTLTAGSTSPNNVTYSWTGPNSFTSGSQNPVIANTAATVTSGVYTVTASYNGCNFKKTTSATVKPVPVFNATTNAPMCTRLNLNFSTSTGFSGVTYSWTGPNSFNSTSANPVILSASGVHSGNYFAKATLNGCHYYDTVTVYVKPLPDKPVANNNGPLCAGSTLNLTSSSTTTGITYSWTGPNSFTSSSQNPNITNTTTSTSGDYIITVTKDNCDDKDTTTVLVKPMPTAVTTSNNGPKCTGDTLKIFSTTSSSGVSYNWAGPNSFTSLTKDTVIANTTSSATGWYKMTVNLNGCTYKDSTYATVHTIPTMPAINNNSPLCAGETLNLSTANVTSATYVWSGPGSFSSNLQNPTRGNMQFADTGNYGLYITVNGCVSPANSKQILINPLPFVVTSANPADSVCKGNSAIFTAYPNNHGGTPTYQWYVNSQAANTGIVFITTTLNNGDVIRCEMTENTKCSVPYTDASNDIVMTVLPTKAPSVSISANPNQPLKKNEYVTFTATPTNAGAVPTYQWRRNGLNIVGATSYIWSANTLNDNDEICVEITSNEKCPQPLTALSNCIKVKVLSGIGDIDTKNRIAIYPNPNNGKFMVEATLRFSPKAEPVKIEVANTLGQVIYKDHIVPANGILKKEIDLGNVAAGLYMLRMHTDSGVSIVKFNVK